jgi:hypothetical protein
VQAIINLRHSGSPNGGESFLEFNIDTNVVNTSSSPEVLGLFENAITDAKYRCSPESRFFCNGKNEINLKPGTLRAERIITDLIDYPNDYLGGVKYEARLESIDSSDFYEIGILVKPNESIDILTSLRNLRDVIISSTDISSTAISYVGVRTVNATDGFFIGSGSLQAINITEPISVPEGDATNSLLGAGAIIAFLYIKKINKL